MFVISFVIRCKMCVGNIESYFSINFSLVCQEIMTREDEALAYRLQDEECMCVL